MGDVLTLVEKARDEITLEEAEQLKDKILEARFDFSDFLKQTRMLKNMGSLGGMMKLIPGMGKMINDDQLKEGERQLKRSEAMIGSMTLEERKDPDLLSTSPSRRKRIAKGSGHSEKDVTDLVTNFQRMRTFMQQMGSGKMGFPGMGGGGFPGMGMPGMTGGMPGMQNPMQQQQPGPGMRGYQPPKKSKKDKKKKGFGTL